MAPPPIVLALVVMVVVGLPVAKKSRTTTRTRQSPDRPIVLELVVALVVGLTVVKKSRTTRTIAGKTRQRVTKSA